MKKTKTHFKIFIIKQEGGPIIFVLECRGTDASISRSLRCNSRKEIGVHGDEL
jgi:hypothetical protein